MGADDLDPHERPARKLSSGAFCMDVTEVSVDEYRQCVDAGRCTPPDSKCNWDKHDHGKHPVNCVDRDQASQYCRFVEKRLPTEEQWEYAARGSDARDYPWGSDYPEGPICAHRAMSAGTCVVGSHPADTSAFGILDMGGNVEEWTATSYTAPGPATDDGSKVVGRGGMWLGDGNRNMRAAKRHVRLATQRIDGMGFRCIRQ